LLVSPEELILNPEGTYLTVIYRELHSLIIIAKNWAGFFFKSYT